MVIALFGDSCTGKSTIAKKISESLSLEIYSGKDYLRLAKNENEAIALFKKKLSSEEMLIYVITEKSQLVFLPESCIRILITASLETIKERFAVRMHGNLSAPVATMLERKYGQFEKEAHDLRIDTEKTPVEEAVKSIMLLIDGKNK